MYGNVLVSCATIVRNSHHLLRSGIDTYELRHIFDEKIYLLNMTNIVSKSDVFNFKYIRINYEGNPTKEDIENLFQYYMISLKDCEKNSTKNYTRHMLCADMQFFKDTCNNYKHYPNETNTGGTIVFDLFFDYLCPNGIMNEMLYNKDLCPYFYIKYLKQENINIVSVKLISYLYWFDIDIYENNESEIQLKYNKIYGEKYVCARTFFDESHTKYCDEYRTKYYDEYFNEYFDEGHISHSFETINGLSHGFFIKLNDNIKLTKLKIKYLGNSIIELCDYVDVDIYTIKFNNWIYIPLSTMKRKITNLNDCFLFEKDGAVDLLKIDDMTIELGTDNNMNIKRVDYMFPLYIFMNPTDVYGNICPINILNKSSKNCKCYPKNRWNPDNNDIFDFGMLDRIAT